MKPVVGRTENSFATAERKGIGSAIVIANSQTLMPIGVGTAQEKRRNLFMVAASDSPYNLPIYPRMYRASKHDSVLFVSTYHELLHWYPDWKFGEAILDSALDAYAIYEMLEHYDVSAIIDLNPRRSKKFTYNEMNINLDGVPVCPIGRKMFDWGVDRKRYRRKWQCPNPCSTTTYGRTFYTSTKDNPRLFPRVKRNSKEWYKRYSLRTGVERCIKRQKIDYHLEDSRGRSSRHWSIRAYSIGMCFRFKTFWIVGSELAF
ncbi:hypothetical protein [Aneurinibacillus migulanus]|uniref:hypothetical protein n=1 Tax=Aneurinibacillus migulanus TaxID=47500 RepID=UPI0020A05DA5|nr:hypothetical protein [Aneurinibacillus migulanus]MCP1358932.1 hypothetical protein [Aneurinibacillus migulanus]